MDEGGSSNTQHLGSLIESESHQCFRFKKNSLALSVQIHAYFSSAQFTLERDNYTTNDTQVVDINRIFKEVRIKLLDQHGMDIKSIVGDSAYVKAQNDVLAVSSGRSGHYRGT